MACVGFLAPGKALAGAVTVVGGGRRKSKSTRAGVAHGTAFLSGGQTHVLAGFRTGTDAWLSAVSHIKARLHRRSGATDWGLHDIRRIVIPADGIGLTSENECRM